MDSPTPPPATAETTPPGEQGAKIAHTPITTLLLEASPDTPKPEIVATSELPVPHPELANRPASVTPDVMVGSVPSPFGTPTTQAKVEAPMAPTTFATPPDVLSTFAASVEATMIVNYHPVETV